ncbi:MAG: flotillin-like protein FloA [Bacteroidota bacterium]
MYSLLATTFIDVVLIIAGITLGVFLLLFIIFVPVGLWISALFSGVFIGPGKMIGMRLRRVDPQIIVNELIKAKKAGLQNIQIDQLEAHHLAQGNVTNVIDALISAKNAGIELNFEEAAAIDLAGRDVLQAVKDSVNPKVIDSPPVEAVAKDGIQLIAKARITVRAHLDKLVGGAGEETVVARVGQGIVAAIGSAETHEDILAEPGKISERIMGEGLTAGTAYDVLSIDIADIDIGQNIGAQLEAEKAETDLKVARAKAEEKRAEAVAEEQVYRARVQKMRAKKLESEAEIPNAISDAFRLGNLGIMDYYRLQNIEADTGMRRSFSGDEGDEGSENLVEGDDN